MEYMILVVENVIIVSPSRIGDFPGSEFLLCHIQFASEKNPFLWFVRNSLHIRDLCDSIGPLFSPNAQESQISIILSYF